MSSSSPAVPQRASAARSPADGASSSPLPQEGLEAALAAVGDRWTARIVAALLDGPGRFKDLQGRVEGIAPNILTSRVRKLEAAGLVVGRAYQQRPVRMEYVLTERGAALADALRLLAAWGAADPSARPPVHDTCGTALEVRWWCPTCSRDVDATAASDDLTWL